MGELEKKDSEARTAKYGRFSAEIVNAMRDFLYLTDNDKRKAWNARFVDEFQRYSFQPKKQNEPKNDGCVMELEGVVNFNPTDPAHLARLQKENLHLMYNKQRAKEIHTALLKSFQQD